MRTEEEIRARRNTDHYHAETSVTFHCEIDGDICDQEEGTFTDQTPDCHDCDKHKEWFLNDKGGE